MEDLKFGGTVNGEVVDGLVSDRVVGDVRGLGKHALDGFCVISCERLTLIFWLSAKARKSCKLVVIKEFPKGNGSQRVVIIFGNHGGSLQD